MDVIFNALADPHRREILEIIKHKDKCVSDILEHFTFRQASLSHHLKVLKDANLVKTQRWGQYIYYSLNKETLLKTLEFFATILKDKETEEFSGN
ncbi:MAG: winged helix-turn-helix transcriptional regulator [bacterium]|nr:winged helix-turn-helix transcriptional regulator [bacterium]